MYQSHSSMMVVVYCYKFIKTMCAKADAVPILV